MPCLRAVLFGQLLCTWLLEQSFTKLSEHLNLDSSCGCQELLVPSVPPVASETSVSLGWCSSLPALLCWFFFSFPLDLQRPLLGGTALRLSFGCSSRPRLRTTAFLFWEETGSMVWHLPLRSGQGCHVQQQWFCADPHQVSIFCASLHWHLLPHSFLQPTPLKAPLLLDVLSSFVAVDFTGCFSGDLITPFKL